MNRHATPSCLILFVVLSYFPFSAYSSGFHNFLQSADVASTAGAGAVTGEYAASAVFYNPAALPSGDKYLGTVSTPIGLVESDFKDDGSVTMLGFPMYGNTRTEDDVFIVPSTAIVFPSHEKLTFGLGIYSPFGQRRNYDDNWVGRYHSIESKIESINFTPAMRLKVSTNLSLGVGVHVQYARLQLSNAIDLGSLCIVTPGMNPLLCQDLGLSPQLADGRLELELDDWEVGYSLGALYSPTESISLGIAYHSGYKHGFSGNADFTLPDNGTVLTAEGVMFSDTNASTLFRFPEILNIGVSYSPTKDIKILGDIVYSHWDVVDTLRVEFENSYQPEILVVNNWRDTMRYSLGIDATASHTLTVRCGLAFEKSAVPDATRSSIMPENDNWQFGIGFGYHINENFSIDMSYTHIKYETAPIESTNSISGTLDGDFYAKSNAIGLQLNAVF